MDIKKGLIIGGALIVAGIYSFIQLLEDSMSKTCFKKRM